MRTFLEESVPVRLVLGMQWGDEGKGKVVDLLGETSDIVARFQGGPNAGHTVKFDGETYILHHVPTGILRSHARCIIGSGMVVNPDSLLEEIRTLEAKGIDVMNRLFISRNAHLILPYHQLFEQASEESGGGIGTTRRGIGPAYADKVGRVGIRMADLLEPSRLERKVFQNVRRKNLVLERVLGMQGVNEEEILNSLNALRKKVGDHIVDTAWMLADALQDGKRILLEGAQGALLDIDSGTYPYVTSSNTTVGGVFTGLGFGFRKFDRIIGVLKAYTTRVGNGPFPTELKGALGEKVRERGGEYGSTTGRPRRCGWFDGVGARYAAQINGIDTLAVTKLDVLDTLEEIHVCTGYRYRGEMLNRFPTDGNVLEEVEPVTEVLPGWKESIGRVRHYEDLPEAARNYLTKMEELVEVPIKMVSVGSTREATIWL